MNIYCKCAIIEEELNTCKTLKSDGMEIQLLNDFVVKYKDTAHYINKLDKQVRDVKIVHTPLHCGDAIDIEDLIRTETYLTFINVCELANEIGKRNNSEVGVIVHTGIDMTDLNSNEHLREFLVNTFRTVLDTYTNIRLYIENVICISNSSTDNFHFRNGSLPTYIEAIKYFRKRLGNGKEFTEEYYSTRITGVLDICHALTSIKMLRGCGKNSTLEDYFAAVFDDNRNIGLIHLAYVKNLGLHKGEHAIGFTEDTFKELRDVMQLYRKYNFSCPITIEVNEESYKEYTSYKKTRELLDKLIER